MEQKIAALQATKDASLISQKEDEILARLKSIEEAEEKRRQELQMVTFNNNMSTFLESKMAAERAILDEKVKSLQVETEKAKEAAHQAALKAASAPAPVAPAQPSTIVVPITQPAAAPTTVTNTVSPAQTTSQRPHMAPNGKPLPAPAGHGPLPVKPGAPAVVNHDHTREMTRAIQPGVAPSESIKKKRKSFG